MGHIRPIPFYGINGAVKMRVKVKSFASLRDVMDKEIELELAGGTTVSELLKALCSRYEGLCDEIFDSPGTLKKYVNILKNGRNIYFLRDLDTVLDDGDDIVIFPPVAGG